MDSFFGSMSETDMISGKITSMKGNNEIGTALVILKMNAIFYDQEVEYKIEGDQLTLMGTIDVGNWSGNDAIAALNNDWMHLDGQDLLDFIAMRDQYEENFRSIIKQGIQEQQIKAKEPEVILFSILSTLRTLYLWNEKRGKLEVNVLKKELVSVLISGIV